MSNLKQFSNFHLKITEKQTAQKHDSTSPLYSFHLHVHHLHPVTVPQVTTATHPRLLFMSKVVNASPTQETPALLRTDDDVLTLHDYVPHESTCNSIQTCQLSWLYLEFPGY